MKKMRTPILLSLGLAILCGQSSFGRCAETSSAEGGMPSECRMKGIWYFDKEKTLADMSANGFRDDELLAALAKPETSEFIAEFTCDKVRMYFPKRDMGKWMSYEVLEQGSDFVVIKQEPILIKKRIEIVGNCWRERVRQAYHNYFCTRPTN